MGNSADRRKERRLIERVAAILSPMQSKKPIDAWLQLIGTAVGIIFAFLPKTPIVVTVGLFVIFACFVHPLWNFWWIEEKRQRQVISLIVLAVFDIWLGWAVWPVVEVPHLQSSLIIDAANSKTVDGHIQIENIGSVPVGLKQIVFGTRGASWPTPKVTDLPLKGKVSESIPPSAIQPDVYGNLDLDITYQTVDNRSYSHHSHFFIAPTYLTSRAVLYPENFFDVAGVLPKDAGDWSGFSNPEGTAFFIVPEMINGASNRVVLSDSKKRLDFDPKGRIVTFSFKVAWHTKTVTLPLQETPSHKHLVVVTWDSQRGTLRVDGKNAT